MADVPSGAVGIMGGYQSGGTLYETLHELSGGMTLLDMTGDFGPISLVYSLDDNAYMASAYPTAIPATYLPAKYSRTSGAWTTLSGITPSASNVAAVGYVSFP
jgi:hypothetical protein